MNLGGQGAALNGADLSGADLSGADLCDTNLSGVDLSGSNLLGSDLSRTDLSRIYLIRTHCRHLDFSSVTVQNKRFINILDLSEATKADLKQRGAIIDDCRPHP
ncbi:MAG: pentapeptide repeat-containing protein [Leptolyngbyaceae cyanobacterium MO_188.B28]|nr:pentapeptide repeat-containing protein [Leptolyngbyaceae cyanobacterium MO_188.B28]